MGICGVGNETIPRFEGLYSNIVRRNTVYSIGISGSLVTRRSQLDLLFRKCD